MNERFPITTTVSTEAILTPIMKKRFLLKYAHSIDVIHRN